MLVERAGSFWLIKFCTEIAGPIHSAPQRDDDQAHHRTSGAQTIDDVVIVCGQRHCRLDHHRHQPLMIALTELVKTFGNDASHTRDYDSEQDGSSKAPRVNLLQIEIEIASTNWTRPVPLSKVGLQKVGPL